MIGDVTKIEEISTQSRARDRKESFLIYQIRLARFFRHPTFFYTPPLMNY